ncbi:NUDIX hydrolase [bacterium]|nr:NUDIX hydrolase [bacterium]
MSRRIIQCPGCGREIELYHNPAPTVDIVIRYQDGIVLIKRKQYPFGWALPGGFVDYGEDTVSAAVREAKEETSLDCEIIGLLGVYSNPQRDPRSHTISTVYVARGRGELRAADDAAEARCFSLERIPSGLAFDHGTILADYRVWHAGETG